jgi:hypothetical protein
MYTPGAIHKAASEVNIHFKFMTSFHEQFKTEQRLYGCIVFCFCGKKKVVVIAKIDYI